MLVCFSIQSKAPARHNQSHNTLCECVRSIYVCGVESIHDVVCRAKALLDHNSRVTCVRWVFGDSSLAVTLPTSHASFLSLVASVSSCVQELFHLRPLALPSEMKRPHKGTGLILNFEL